MKKVLLLIVLLLIITGCSYDPYKMPKKVYIDLNENSFNIYEDHYSTELIKDSNVEILDNDKLENSELGTYKYTINYKYKKRKYKYDVEYNIVDNTPPVIIRRANSVTVLINSNDDLCKNITWGDNYDAKATCKIDGEYNTSVAGTYDLEYVITDSSSNEFRKDFKLNVVYKLPSTTYSTTNYLYLDDIMKYKNDDTNIGIDVSKWQGNVDFNKVKNAGIEFVIIRLGVENDGDYILDPKFETYYEQAKNAGLKIGVYVYTYAVTKNEATKMANWIIENLKGKKIDLPIAYDWEDWQHFNDYNVSLHTFSTSYLEFEKIIKKNGYDSMLYSSKYYLQNVWLYFENSNIWLAHYIDQTDYTGDYILWQMTSSAKIPGITENTVDIDILYKKKMN